MSSSPPESGDCGVDRITTLEGGVAASSLLVSCNIRRLDLRFLVGAMFVPSVFGGCVGLILAPVQLLSLAGTCFWSEV